MSRRLLTPLAALFLLTGLLVGLTGCSLFPSDPFAGKSILQNADNPAVGALSYYRQRGDAEHATLIAKIAAEPTATWLLPEKYPQAAVGGEVSGVVADAVQKNAVAVFVVYGIGDRDCGSNSSGGLPAGQYQQWVSAIAGGISSGANAAIILEPDALAQAGKCASVSARTSEIAAAVSTLAGTGAAVYLDAGNSDWIPAKTMAARLTAAGVGGARGFASNVSNYQSLPAERAYDQSLSSMLNGAHYVIDTSRNGRGADGSVWCNANGRGLGAAPGAVSGQGAEDADLWVKQPGESDGTCNGGPTAGVWWPYMAFQLAQNTDS